ncbi:MAG: outer membrane protein assembly factor BamE [Alphaproteobacteria bacterium]|nr:outer membrane protein assembly factor BamE [Alphaproteobacteria bacterium]
MNKIQSVVPILIVLMLFACSPKVDSRGYVNQVSLKEQITIGATTRDEVMAKFGSPSSQSSFGAETWYYISQRKEGTAFLKPEVAAQQVVRIEFDGAGVVQKLEGFDEKDSKDVELVSRTTATEGHTLGFFEQILGNIGRFNSGADGASSAAPGRKPSSRGGF